MKLKTISEIMKNSESTFMKYNIFTLLKNIKFLLSHNIKEEFRNQKYDMFLNFEDYCDFEMKENQIEEENRLHILNYEETIITLLSCPKSFCRFGDGEIEIMQGKSIPFQKYDKRLADIMLTILSDFETDMYVGINYNYFHSSKMLNDYNRKFYLLDARKYRHFLLDNCTSKRTYIAAAFNQLYMVSNELDYDAYYNKIRLLFKNRNLAIFVGKGILSKYKYDVFDTCNSKVIIEGPSKDSFTEYDKLLQQAKSYEKDTILCFILGPTSKALVYELTKLGYTAWDIGHLAKDYDMYMNRQEKDAKAVSDFYKPD